MAYCIAVRRARILSFSYKMFTKNALLAFGCLRICECKHKGTFAVVAVVVIFSSPFLPASSLVGRRRRRLSHLKRRTFSYQSPSVRPRKKRTNFMWHYCLLLSSTTEPTLHKLIHAHRSTPTHRWSMRRKTCRATKKKIVSCETRSNCRHAICGQFRRSYMRHHHIYAQAHIPETESKPQKNCTKSTYFVCVSLLRAAHRRK